MILDNERSQEILLQAIENGKSSVSTKTRAVMIGHVWSSELAETMIHIYPHLIEEGYTLEDLSRVVQGVPLHWTEFPSETPAVEVDDENPGD